MKLSTNESRASTFLDQWEWTRLIRSNSLADDQTEEDEDIDYDEEEPEDDPDVQDVNWFWILIFFKIPSIVISYHNCVSPFVFVEMPFCATILISVD